METLHKIANGSKNKFMDLANTSEYKKACEVAISVLSIVEQRRHSNDSKVSYLLFISKAVRIFAINSYKKQ